MSTPLAPAVPQLLGGCMEPLAMYSATDAAAMVSERPASDHASQVAARWLTLASPRCCSLAPAVITPVYRTTVSETLRKALRDQTFLCIKSCYVCLAVLPARRGLRPTPAPRRR